MKSNVLRHVTVFNELGHTFCYQMAVLFVLFRQLEAYGVSWASTPRYLTIFKFLDEYSRLSDLEMVCSARSSFM